MQNDPFRVIWIILQVLAHLVELGEKFLRCVQHKRCLMILV